MTSTSKAAWGGGAVKAWGKYGAVSCSQPLVSQIGIDVLKQGGNAVDAIIAMSAGLAVVDSAMTGIGGCGFLLVYRANTRSTKVLNFSGVTPQDANPNQFKDGEDELYGAKSCLVPGAPSGWAEAIEKEGTMSLDSVLTPAIKLARDGFPLNAFDLVWLKYAYNELSPEIKNIYTPDKLREGSIIVLHDLANTIERLAKDGPDSFYKGAVAHKIVSFIKERGGILTVDDLASYHSIWQEPIETEVVIANQRLSIQTLPPNSIGFQLLETLKLLERFDLKQMEFNDYSYIHTLTECFKFAAEDRIKYAGDPKLSNEIIQNLLSPKHINLMLKRYNAQRAHVGYCGQWQPSYSQHTSSLAVIDKDGNVASMTGTLAEIYGSQLMVPGTGVILNGSMMLADLLKQAPTPNVVRGRYRPAHPIAPLMVFDAQTKTFWFTITTPGGYTILQTSVQMFLNLVLWGKNPQEAVEAPRFSMPDKTLVIERYAVDEDVLKKLTKAGHRIEIVSGTLDCTMVGNGQIVMIDPNTASRLAAGDPRRGSLPLAY